MHASDARTHRPLFARASVRLRARIGARSIIPGQQGPWSVPRRAPAFLARASSVLFFAAAASSMPVCLCTCVHRALKAKDVLYNCRCFFSTLHYHTRRSMLVCAAQHTHTGARRARKPLLSLFFHSIHFPPFVVR